MQPSALMVRTADAVTPSMLRSDHSPDEHLSSNQRTGLDIAQEHDWESEGGLVGRTLEMPATAPFTRDGSWRDDGYWATGTILTLRAGGFGSIASDSFGRPWALQFHAAAVTGGKFDRLQVGERVRFRQVTLPGDPSRARAVWVTSLA
jgi:cold shock CspA family protein